LFETCLRCCQSSEQPGSHRSPVELSRQRFIHFHSFGTQRSCARKEGKVSPPDLRQNYLLEISALTPSSQVP
jgi:hypothetical protein